MSHTSHTEAATARYKDHPRHYLAYGSNLAHGQMRDRCPDAEPVAACLLPDHRLVFSSVASIEPCAGSKVPAAIWKVSPSDIAALDRYEGFPRSYDKRYQTCLVNGERVEVFWYVFAQVRDEYPPGDYYLEVLAEGYEDWGLPLEQLEQAAIRAYDAGWPEELEA